MLMIFHNFFRKDLKLRDRWWHRLLLVIFFALLVSGFYTTYSELFSEDYPYIPQWKITSTLDERIGFEVIQVKDLKKDGERVEERGDFYVLNSTEGERSLYEDFYCSSDLENKVSEVQNRSGIEPLYIRDIYGRSNVPMEIFEDYVRENNIKCLIPDAYTYDGIGKFKFLEPIGPNSLFGDDLVFYKKSSLLTAFHVLKMFSFVVGLFAGLAVLYYKVFLYIIFGNKDRA